MTSVTTVTGLTADRMIEMENATVVDGEVVGNNLILETRDGTPIDAGNVRGPQGVPGAPGTNGTNGAGDFICTSTTRPASPINGLSIYETDTGLRRTWNGTRWKCQERVLCTVATRPAGLVAADEGVYAYCIDVNYGYTWDGTRWAIDGRVICTSSTRPTGLTAADEGVKIYETDTNYEYIWSGTVFAIPGPLGLLGPPQFRTANRTAPTTQTSIMGAVQTLTVAANRILRASLRGGFFSVTGTAPAVIFAYVWVDGVMTHMLYNHDFETTGTRDSCTESVLITGLSAGSHTFEAMLRSGTGGATAQISATAAPIAASTDPGPIVFWVEDIGPA